MVNDSRHKAMQTRVTRLSLAFKEEHGRLPTVDEVNELVKAELSAAQAKSRINYSGSGGFKAATPEQRREWGAKGGAKSRKGAKRADIS